jgi:hypothetical protein
MTIRAVFFDMGGTIETYGWTPELRLQETASIRQRLVEAGISLGLTDQQLYETISTGLEAYHQVSLQTMEELSPARVWNEYILAGCPVDRERLAEIAEDLMVFIETSVTTLIQLYYPANTAAGNPIRPSSIMRLAWQMSPRANVLILATALPGTSSEPARRATGWRCRYATILNTVKTIRAPLRMRSLTR